MGKVRSISKEKLQKYQRSKIQKATAVTMAVTMAMAITKAQH